MATVTANAPGVECLLLDRKPFIEFLGELKELQSVVVNKGPRPSEFQEKVSGKVSKILSGGMKKIRLYTALIVLADHLLCAVVMLILESSII